MGALPYMIKDDERYRIITDQVGSVRLVVNATDGTVVQRIDYTAFGQILSDTNPGFQPFGFAGGIYDVDTGLVRFGVRDYDPSVGRWTAKDSTLFGGLQANLYVYTFNDPVNYQDVSGEIPTVVLGAGLGAIAGAGVAALRGGDARAIIAGAFGGAVAGAIAGTGVGLGLGAGGVMAAQGFGAGFGGLVGDFVNLRPGMDLVTPGEVGSRFAIRAGFGIVGGQAAGAIGRLAAPGAVGAVNRGFNELVVGGACAVEGEFATGN